MNTDAADARRWRWFREHWNRIVFHTSTREDVRWLDRLEIMRAAFSEQLSNPNSVDAAFDKAGALKPDMQTGLVVITAVEYERLLEADAALAKVLARIKRPLVRAHGPECNCGICSKMPPVREYE